MATHADKLEQQNPQLRSKGGNNTINPSSVRRRGVPTSSDISGGVQSVRGVGGERGGKIAN